MAVEMAKSKGMHVYIVDEGKYPSGFAGGKFSQERSDLRMQGMNAQRIAAGPSHLQFVENQPNSPLNSRPADRRVTLRELAEALLRHKL